MFGVYGIPLLFPITFSGDIPGTASIFYSGGAKNQSPEKSIGGEISKYPLISGTLHNLFDPILEPSRDKGGTDLATPGVKDYRVVYLKNTDVGLGFIKNGKLWLDENTGVSGISYRLNVYLKNQTFPLLAHENALPNVSTSFQNAPTSQENGIPLPILEAGDYVAICIERSISSTKDYHNNKGPIFEISWGQEE
jgi:hypothetical protein